MRSWHLKLNTMKLLFLLSAREQNWNIFSVKFSVGWEYCCITFANSSHVAFWWFLLFVRVACQLPCILGEENIPIGQKKMCDSRNPTNPSNLPSNIANSKLFISKTSNKFFLKEKIFQIWRLKIPSDLEVSFLLINPQNVILWSSKVIHCKTKLLHLTVYSD